MPTLPYALDGLGRYLADPFAGPRIGQSAIRGATPIQVSGEVDKTRVSAAASLSGLVAPTCPFVTNGVCLPQSFFVSIHLANIL
jgi:hypothetical protein